MPDKRNECGCHRTCSDIPHECEKRCTWPDCLTAAEHVELLVEMLEAE